MNAFDLIAARACQQTARGTLGRVFGGLGLLAALAGCSALPSAPPRAALHDFGPGAMAPEPTDRRAPMPPVAWTEIESPGLPEGSTAVHYRLAYADAQQLRPYALARWSQPPAQLVQQRLREHLGQRRAVLSASEGGSALVLRTEIEEFSHVFTSPTDSAGWVRLRATVTAPSAPGQQALRGQRVFVARPAAATADAAGGARALAQATEQIARELDAWLETLAPR